MPLLAGVAGNLGSLLQTGEMAGVTPLQNSFRLPVEVWVVTAEPEQPQDEWQARLLYGLELQGLVVVPREQHRDRLGLVDDDPKTVLSLAGTGPGCHRDCQRGGTHLHGFRRCFWWQVGCIWYPCVVSLGVENHLSRQRIWSRWTT